MRPTLLVIQAEPDERYDEHGGHSVRFNGQHAYYRPYDGSSADEVEDEAAHALGDLVRQQLGHPKEKPGWMS